MSIMDTGKAVYRNLKFKALLCTTTNISVEEAEVGLQNFWPRVMPKFSQKNFVDPQFDVMLVVPVYNMECHLEQCINSIMMQKTKYTYQAVFVNDGSTDGSYETLRRCVTAPHIIINQENQGLSAARNIALRHITGRYVLFLDSDDYLASDAIERLVDTADKTGADIAEAGHSFFNSQGENSQFLHSVDIQRLSYYELYGFAWGKLIRSQLLEDFCFPIGYLFEDTVMATLLHPRCQYAVSVPVIAYYYRDNSQGITHMSKAKKEAVDTFWITKYCLEERVRRKQTLSQLDYNRYLIAVWRNWIRTNGLPNDVQEWIFVLTCDLFRDYLPFCYKEGQVKMQMLEKSIRHNSYHAFCFVLERWDVL